MKNQMSRKPQTPNDDNGPAGMNQQQSDIPVGNRFSNQQEVLDIEADLAAEGVELPNRAIPMRYHVTNLDSVDIPETIELETAKDHPNKSLIGYLNEVQG